MYGHELPKGEDRKAFDVISGVISNLSGNNTLGRDEWLKGQKAQFADICFCALCRMDADFFKRAARWIRDEVERNRKERGRRFNLYKDKLRTYLLLCKAMQRGMTMRRFREKARAFKLIDDHTIRRVALEVGFEFSPLPKGRRKKGDK